jgi:uncharacterized protein
MNRLLSAALAVPLFTVTGFLSLPPASQAASFDCTKTDLAADEAVICKDLSLNDLDVKMVTTFDLLTGLMPMGNRDLLRDEQLSWLKTRQACNGDADCIRSAYETRLTQLGEAYKTLIKPM